MGELQQCIRVEQWQASCDRQQAAALREKLTALSRDLKKAATLTGIATDFESMNATVQEIVVSAAEAAEKAAAVEAEGRFATKIEALSTVKVQHLTEQIGLLSSAPTSLAAAAENSASPRSSSCGPGRVNAPRPSRASQGRGPSAPSSVSPSRAS